MQVEHLCPIDLVEAVGAPWPSERSEGTVTPLGPAVVLMLDPVSTYRATPAAYSSSGTVASRPLWRGTPPRMMSGIASTAQLMIMVQFVARPV